MVENKEKSGAGWTSRKLWITIGSIALAAASPLWIQDTGIYYGLVGFLAAASGLYGWANNMAKIK